MNSAVHDLCRTLTRLDVIALFAWGDLKARYRRSTLGPLWLVLSTAIGVVGLGLVWSTVLKMDRATFIPSLAVGLVCWQFISGCITEAPGALLRHAAHVRNLPLPYTFYALQLLARQLLNLAHTLLVVAVVLAIFPRGSLATALLAIPGLLLVLANLGWVILLLSLLGARFRDLEPLVQSVMPIAFFLTPVVFTPETLGSRALLAWVNPFTYPITALRDPLLGVAPEPFVWAVLAISAVAGWLGVLALLQNKYRHVAFWV